MPTYRIWFTFQDEDYEDVEAHDRDEAMENFAPPRDYLEITDCYEL